MTDEERRAKAREASRRYRQRHPERVRAAKQKWAKANPEKKQEANRRWVAANPEVYRQCVQKNIKAKAKRRKTDPEYALMLQEYQKAYKLRKKSGMRSKRMPAWLAGTLPKVTPTTVRLHLASVDESGARRSA